MNKHSFSSRLHYPPIPRLAAVMLVALALCSLVSCGRKHIPTVAEIGEIQAAVAAGDLEKVKALLKNSPDLVFSKDTNGRTPLENAAFYGYKDIAVFLLTKKADVDAKDNDDVTPLDRAAANDSIGIVELLITNGANVNARDVEGWTPLFWGDEYKDVTELLLAKGANVNVRNNKGNTPLLEAVRSGYKDVVETLLENKADVNQKNKDGNTPLHMAALMGKKDVVELLLAYRADVNATDDHGHTPLFWAGQHPDVAELLRQHGGHE